mmetsp:Transcript_2237/g.1997  ORF Transcript_2237/g.1997 Transcript_2237/m.1997 type:complete len:96 (+) Transcript_2237:660-947(+)
MHTRDVGLHLSETALRTQAIPDAKDNPKFKFNFPRQPRAYSKFVKFDIGEGAEDDELDFRSQNLPVRESDGKGFRSYLGSNGKYEEVLIKKLPDK